MMSVPKKIEYCCDPSKTDQVVSFDVTNNSDTALYVHSLDGFGTAQLVPVGAGESYKVSRKFQGCGAHNFPFAAYRAKNPQAPDPPDFQVDVLLVDVCPDGGPGGAGGGGGAAGSDGGGGGGAGGTTDGGGGFSASVVDPQNDFEPDCGGPGPFTTQGVPEADILNLDVIPNGPGSVIIEITFNGDAQSAWNANKIGYGAQLYLAGGGLVDIHSNADNSGWKVSNGVASVTHEWLAPNKLRLIVTNIPADIIGAKAQTMGSTGPNGVPKFTFFCDTASAP